MARARLRLVAVLVSAVIGAGAGGCGVAGGPQSGAGRSSGSSAATAPVDPAIADVMDGAGMTPEARKEFLGASPKLEDKDTLAQSCAGLDSSGSGPGDAAGTSHTYGCVVAGKIHIRVFGAPQLHDMIYVIAAHELLHVVYGDLRTADRVRLDAELAAARAGNTALDDRLKVYAAAGDDTPNEVHSVLGTEFADLSPDLEAHYARYFDRAAVLADFKRTLGDREEAIRQLQAQVDDMKHQLDAMSADMEALRSAGDLRTFNARVPAYNALVKQHNTAVDQLQALVEAHKALVSS